MARGSAVKKRHLRSRFDWRAACDAVLMPPRAIPQWNWSMNACHGRTLRLLLLLLLLVVRHGHFNRITRVDNHGAYIRLAAGYIPEYVGRIGRRGRGIASGCTYTATCCWVVLSRCFFYFFCKLSPKVRGVNVVKFSPDEAYLFIVLSLSCTIACGSTNACGRQAIFS